MTRPAARDIRSIHRSKDADIPPFQLSQPRESLVESLDVTGGMVTSRPRAEQTKNSFWLLRNARTRDYWTGRRPGTATFLAPPPITQVPLFWNWDPSVSGGHRVILNLFGIYLENGDFFLVAARRSSVLITRSLDGWVETINRSVGGTLAGTVVAWENDIADSGRVDFAQMFDWLFLANPENRIHYVDLQTSTIREIAGAPRARYVTNFAERIIAANIRAFIGGPVETRIQWSANGDPLDWVEDDSTGFVDMITSPSDTGDAITGLFGIERAMVILRERSIWLATRQPIETAPFRLDPIVADIGCDLPHTAVQIPGGVMWADYRTQGVYIYQVGGVPQKISKDIDDELFRGFTAPIQDVTKWSPPFASATDAQFLPIAAYDPFNLEYHLAIPTDPTFAWLTKTWVYNLTEQAWSFDDGPRITALGNFSVPSDRVMIDELVGTIDAQAGSIDELSPISVPAIDIFKAVVSGEVIRQSYDFDTDWDGERFEFEAVSQNLGQVFQERTARELQFKVETTKPGFVQAETSLDRRNWRNTRQTTMTGIDTEQVAPITSAITGRNIWWRLRCIRGDLRLTGWWARMFERSKQVPER